MYGNMILEIGLMHLAGMLQDDAREDNDLTLPSFAGYPEGIIQLRNQLQAMRIERRKRCNTSTTKATLSLG